MSYTPHNDLIEQYWPHREEGQAYDIKYWIQEFTGEEIDIAQEPLLRDLGGIDHYAESVTSLSGGYGYGYGESFSFIGSGGFYVGGQGTMSLQTLSPMACAGCAISYVGSGGLSIGGSGAVSSNIFSFTGSGGLSIGGNGIVSLGGEVFDGFAARYRLDDDSTMFEDSSLNQLHGTSENPPTLVDGLLCQGASYFEEQENGAGNPISIPQDSIASDREWSVSVWVKLEDLYKPRTLYSRGHNDLGNRCVFSLETSLINHVVLSVQTDEGVFEAFSDTTLNRFRWYHVAASVKGSTMKTFINGVQQTSYQFEGTPLPLTNGGYIGRKNNGGHPTASMLRLHVFPEAKSAAWFKAEHDNFCLSGWLLIGSATDSTSGSSVAYTTMSWPDYTSLSWSDYTSLDWE